MPPRVAARLWLKDDPEGIETYARYHLHPFPELYDLIRAAGISRYTIWLDGTDLFLTKETDTPDRGETLDMGNPVHLEWATTMRPLFDPRVADGAGHPTEVIALDPDADPGRAQMTYRLGLRSGPGALDAVAAAHRAMPSDVVDALRAAGTRRQWTWVEDGDAWTYRESDDIDATEAALAASAPYQAWSSAMADHLDDRTRADGPRRTREVFRCD
jgi:L-rhamnose mutarotase